MLSNLVPGQLVISSQGRDSGKKMIILEILDKQYVLISDGKTRKVNKPKKKKLKHLKKTNKIFYDLQKKILEKNISDNDIRKKIAEYCSANIREEC